MSVLNRFLFLGVAVVAVLTVVPAAEAQPDVEVQRFVDLGFTDVSEVEDAVEWRDGYVAATKGGVVLWPGGEAREVLTTIDGLPSNVVWSVAWTEGGVLAGTELGAVLVDPANASVESLEAPDHAQPAVSGFVEDVIVTDDGGWWILDRGGNVTHRAPDGTWQRVPQVPKSRANDLYADGERVMAVGQEPEFGPGNRNNWSAFDLEGDAWVATHHTHEPPIAIAAFQGMDVVGMREGGVLAYEGGERVDLGAPSSMDNKTVLELRPEGSRLWVATTDGLYVYRAEASQWTFHGSDQLPSTWVSGVLPDPSAPGDLGIGMLATADGLALPGESPDWTLHTGVNGPDGNQLLSLATRDGEQVWAGSRHGVTIHYPSVRLWNHWDQGELGRNIDSSRVHDIEHRGNLTWFATNYGIYQLDWEEDDWRIFLEEDPPREPGNTFYDVTSDREWLWMPEWGSGLLRHEIGTNNTYKYRIFEGLISHGLTCTDTWREFVVVCMDRALQLFDRTQATPDEPLGPSLDRCNNYACNYTAPMNTTLAALPDGPRLWIGSAHAGLLSFTRDEDEGVAVEDQWTPADGLPSKEVRAIEPANEGVWVGTTGGLARVTLDGVQETWETGDGLGEPTINDLERLGDVLYMATFEGLYRLDLGKRALLPLFEGTGSFGELPGQVSVTFPDPGARLSAPTNMTGTASVPGRPVEEVQVRVDEGDWKRARGTSEWSYRIPVGDLDLGSHEAAIRVIANGSSVAETTLSFEVVERSRESTSVELLHAPPGRVVAGRTHFLTASVEAPDPWKVEMEGSVGGERIEPAGRRTGDETRFAVTVPPREAGSQLRYRFLVKSSAGERWFPGEGSYTANVVREQERGIRLDLEPTRLRLAPGESATIEGGIENTGTVIENVSASARGLRASWVSASPAAPLPLSPGETLATSVSVQVPQDAEPGTTGFTVSASTEDGARSDATALALVVPEPDPRPADGGAGAPAPGVPAVATGALAALAAAAARSRREVEP